MMCVKRAAYKPLSAGMPHYLSARGPRQSPRPQQHYRGGSYTMLGGNPLANGRNNVFGQHIAGCAFQLMRHYQLLALCSVDGECGSSITFQSLMAFLDSLLNVLWVVVLTTNYDKILQAAGYE